MLKLSLELAGPFAMKPFYFIFSTLLRKMWGEINIHHTDPIYSKDYKRNRFRKVEDTQFCR